MGDATAEGEIAAAGNNCLEIEFTSLGVHARHSRIQIKLASLPIRYDQFTFMFYQEHHP